MEGRGSEGRGTEKIGDCDDGARDKEIAPISDCADDNKVGSLGIDCSHASEGREVTGDRDCSSTAVA